MSNVIHLERTTWGRESKPARSQGGSSTVSKLNVATLESPVLREAVREWRTITGNADAFVLGFHGSEIDIWRTSALSAGVTSLVLVDPSTDVDEWRLIRLKDSEREDVGLSLAMARIGDFPTPEMRASINATVLESVRSRRISAYRIVGPGPNGTVSYDVCRFPILDSRGQVARLLTKADVYQSVSGS